MSQKVAMMEPRTLEFQTFQQSFLKQIIHILRVRDEHTPVTNHTGTNLLLQ
jgi:hypothetical protein